MKHNLFVVGKQVRNYGKIAYFKTYDALYSNPQTFDNYVFDNARYRRSFLNLDADRSLVPSVSVPRKVYCFWTGDNPMSENRKKNLDIIQATLKTAELVLVTPQNIHDYILESHPLHPCYEYLSLVHKSDYLRAYFMHHYGGGYLDIKKITTDWTAAFDDLESNAEKWAIGYPESHSKDVARLTGRLGHDLRKYHKQLVGNGAYIFRSTSPFTYEWLHEQERRLDYFFPQAERFSGGERGEIVGYPISWQDLLGRVFHPLCLKHNNRIMFDSNLKPEFTDYL